MSTYLVVGAGPVGSTTALKLAETGHRVIVATRSGNGPTHPQIEHRRVDAGNEQALTEASSGASAILNCANPPYASWDTDWPPIANAILGAAKQTGAGVVTMSNLYGYGPKHQLMRADTPLDATGKKGRVRADMWRTALATHQAGQVRTAEVRAGDFFGPGVVDANMGQRVVPRLLKGKGVQLLGATDVPHSFSYIPDVAKVLTAVTIDEGSWGRPWLVPSVTVTQRGMVEALAGAAGTTRVKISTLPSFALKAIGFVVPMMRELQEIQYQFTAPFVADASDTTERFGIPETGLEEAARATVAWWKARQG